MAYLNVGKSSFIFIASSRDNGKLYEICVTILNLNVFGTLSETSYDSIILLKKWALAAKKNLPTQHTAQERKKFKCSDFDVEK